MWGVAGVLGIVLTPSVVGCSSISSSDMATAVSEVVATSAPNSKEALEARAHRMNTLASQGDAAAAYQFYSQRCKDIIGGLDGYQTALNEWLKSHTPQYSGVTVRVSGSSAQVVSVDSDPKAPASSMAPRTWMFTDDAWHFDNC
jgi:hypothetical protein